MQSPLFLNLTMNNVASAISLEKVIRYSIVMTAYNRQQQLERTLESFRYHGYGSDVEVIIVDDASAQPVDCSFLSSFARS